MTGYRSSELGIATRTVEVHRAKLMEKLSARSLSDVLRIAFAARPGQLAMIEPAQPSPSP